MSDFTKEEYLGAIFKLKVMARNKTPIRSNLTYTRFNLGICSRDILGEDKRQRTRSQFCPLDLDKTTEVQAYGCLVRCAHFGYNQPVEQIYKLIEDFEVKE